MRERWAIKAECPEAGIKKIFVCVCVCEEERRKDKINERKFIVIEGGD